MPKLPSLFFDCETIPEVKQRYRELAVDLHPDRHLDWQQGAHEAFLQLQSEYEQAKSIIGRLDYLEAVDRYNENQMQRARPKTVIPASWDGLEMSLGDRVQARAWYKLIFERDPCMMKREDYEWFQRLDWAIRAYQKANPVQPLEPIESTPIVPVKPKLRVVPKLSKAAKKRQQQVRDRVKRLINSDAEPLQANLFEWN